ncbi:M12 family metallopeptidase [Chryseobacterium phocaeense]|uniref:M12 family metallopeptidase n=1 Tax=Chryseobacterium phocaeense TaxID=1816690 RepID=UPI0011188F00|nr:M12 family metallopeptidase [Chryseobacterium phocaeense]
MKISILLLAFLAILSCTDKKSEAQSRLCTELYSDPFYWSPIQPKAAVVKKSLWPHSVHFPLKITVKFLNGTEFQKNKVREYAKLWVEASADGSEYKFHTKKKVNFRFIPYDVTTSGNTADIRIFFHEGGSSSYIGTDGKTIPQDKPTMFFGWINENEPEESIKQVVLHEFGHALGFMHEHQHPGAVIPWDKEKVYEYYKNSQSPPWTKEMVDYNIFYRYSVSTTNYTAYDPKSIMHYAVPAFLTVGGYSTPWNSDLSALDRSFLKQIYPYHPCIVNESCCYDKNGKQILCP